MVDNSEHGPNVRAQSHPGRACWPQKVPWSPHQALARQMRAATPTWLGCAMCERSATAAEKSRVPEPSVAAPGWRVGCACEARHLASAPPPGVSLWQTLWFRGTILAINEDTCFLHSIYYIYTFAHISPPTHEANPFR